MRHIQIDVNDLAPGMVLARNVWHQDGKLLLAGDKRVTESMIVRLKKHKVTEVYIYINATDAEIINMISAKGKNSLKEKTNKKGEIKTKVPNHRKKDINVYNAFYKQISTMIGVSIRELFRADEDIEAIRKPILSVIATKDVITLLMALRVKAHYLLNHSVEVAVLCSVVGQKLELDRKELDKLLLAALLHDVGMMEINDELIFKISPLSLDEQEMLESHVAKSVLLLSEYRKIDKEILEIIYQHHERPNGTGYPRGLAEGDINGLSKILSASDVYSAISHDRCYRDKLSPREKMEFLYASGNYIFDYEVIKILIESISVYYRGQWVRLNTGHAGIISDVDPEYPTRPTVKLVFDQNGGLMRKQKEISLMDRDLTTVNIERIL